MEKNSTPTNGKKQVSYSQFSTWYNCRHRFFLDHVKGLREFEDNVNTCFGTAMHEAVQLYIETLYKKSAKDADAHDLHEVFKTAFDKELKNTKVTVEPSLHKEFCDDGDNIIIAFTNM